jgi:Na+-driven multidrug efflux pump
VECRWVGTALVVALMLAVIGGTVEARNAKRLREAIASASGEWAQDDLRGLQRVSSPIYVGFFGAFQIVALLFLMTNKPGLAGAIAGCAVAASASALAASVRIRLVRRARNVPVS